MSRWGVAALVAAAAAVLAIGMVAIRLSDRSVTAHDGSAPSPRRSTSSSHTAPDQSDRRERRPVSRHRRRVERAPVGVQVRRLRRRLGSGGADAFYVTLSLRRPVPLTLATGRRTPLPVGLPGSTGYSLYSETRDDRPVRTRVRDLGDPGSVARARRTVVVGLSMPVDDYRDAKAGLRRLPIATRVVGRSLGRADYVPDAPVGHRSLASWRRYYGRA